MLYGLAGYLGMREKNATTHILIERELRIYQRERSAVWQVAFNVDGRWNRASTNERDLAKAKKAAHDILIKANVKKELNISPVTRKLKDVANTVLKQLEADIKEETAKPIYKDYVSVLKTYVIPILGKFNVNNIKREALDEYETKRTKKMGKPASNNFYKVYTYEINCQAHTIRDKKNFWVKTVPASTKTEIEQSTGQKSVVQIPETVTVKDLSTKEGAWEEINSPIYRKYEEAVCNQNFNRKTDTKFSGD